MAQESSERDQHRIRVEKLQRLTQEGINAYPASTKRTHTIAMVLENFAQLQEIDVTVVGRIMAIRGHGKSSFITLQDGSGVMQCFVRSDGVGEQAYAFFLDLDIGDIVEVSGVPFETKRGEKSVDAQQLRLLAKALRPLPEKWHGLADTEKRYRQRYLDILTNPESKVRFLLRTKLIRSIRHFLDDNGFVEVETPVLQPIYGGAAAKPFTTQYEALDSEMYLRISDELYLKRLIVGGLERVYEIGKDFRNEGIDTEHLQEFTMLEFYWAYADYEQLMHFTEELLAYLLQQTLGKAALTYNGTTLDFAAPLPRVNFYQLFTQHTTVELSNIDSLKSLEAALKKAKIAHEPADSLPALIDHVYKKMIRPTLIQPVFLVDYPYELVPLAKRKEDNPQAIAMFQLVAAGSELVKAYSELNDPVDQRARMLQSQKEAHKRSAETHPLDEDYLLALEHGMPPTAGFGLGIDRLMMLLSDTHAIRDVVLFPTLKQKGEQ